MSENVLVTGVNGQLGHDVVAELTKRGIHCKGVDSADFDITDRTATNRYIRIFQPTAVVHCAAYTNVNGAEENEEICRAVNVDGTRNIAEACDYLQAKLVYISTDYVFGGDGNNPYNVNDETHPVNVYGRTKLEGEEAARLNPKTFIVRTSWVFGMNGNNFVRTMIKLGRVKNDLDVVSDQVGSPTFTEDLSRLVCDMIATTKYGTYHATNEGYCSWAEFAQAIMKEAHLICKIMPVYTINYPTKAKRPLNSRLSKICLDFASFQRLPKWQDALGRYVAELAENGMLD